MLSRPLCVHAWMSRDILFGVMTISMVRVIQPQNFCVERLKSSPLKSQLTATNCAPSGNQVRNGNALNSIARTSSSNFNALLIAVYHSLRTMLAPTADDDGKKLLLAIFRALRSRRDVDAEIEKLIRCSGVQLPFIKQSMRDMLRREEML